MEIHLLSIELYFPTLTKQTERKNEEQLETLSMIVILAYQPANRYIY